jgi:hypothetical protein
MSIITGAFHLLFAIIGAVLTAIVCVASMSASALIGISIGRWLADRDTRMDESDELEDEEVTHTYTQTDRIRLIYDEIMEAPNVQFADKLIDLYERVKSGEISQEDWKLLRQLIIGDFKANFIQTLRMIMQELKAGRLNKSELEAIYIRVKNITLVRELQNALTLKLNSQKTTIPGI